MSASTFSDLKAHVGHTLECVVYGDYDNVAIECTKCGTVLLDYNKETDVSEPFTRDEAKSAVWAQVEDFELPERIKMLFEVMVNMIQLLTETDVTDEALVDELTEAITAKGTFITDHIDELFANNAEAICQSPLRTQVEYVLEQCGEEWFRECLLEEDADEEADRKTALGDDGSP